MTLSSRKHFHRENMVIGAGASVSDIMRWNFFIMSTESYVLQLSENVKRSFDYKLRNGEWTGVAPVGYVNYQNENSKNSIRPDKWTQQKFNVIIYLYALGETFTSELACFADTIGLHSHIRCLFQVSCVLSILHNSLYYGKMLEKIKLHIHIYKPLINKKLLTFTNAFLNAPEASHSKKGKAVCILWSNPLCEHG